MLRNTEHSWSLAVRLLHWSMALLIFLQFMLGWFAVSWRLSPTKLQLFFWHKSLGILLLVLVLIRLGVWLLRGSAPVFPSDTPRWERIAAHVTHGALYALMLAMPFSGWAINSSANIPFRVFGLFSLPSIVPVSKALEETAKNAHLALFVIFVAMLVLHIGAALRHHFVKRNDVLRRMWTSP